MLDDISFEIPAGQAFCLLGRSGTGKSVTLRHIVGLVQPDSGKVVRRGAATSRRWRAASSPTCGSTWASCFRMRALFDSMSVGDNVAFPMRRHTDWSDAEIRERATKKLADVGLDDGLRQDAGRSVGRHEEAGRRSPAPWRSTRRSCSWTSRAPASIRSPRGEIDDLLVKTKQGGTTLVVVTHNIPSARVIGDDVRRASGRAACSPAGRSRRSTPATSRSFRRSCVPREAVRWRHQRDWRASACSCWAGSLLFAVGLFMIGDRQMAFATKFTVYTEFKKITGLQPGANRPCLRRQGRDPSRRSFRRPRRAGSSG